MNFPLNKQTENRIVAFTKYARFISEKFDVQIEFDSLKAHTDGNTITLPNLIGMSEREIDFLYCILLHEVGHIRYTDFANEDVFQVKTENHFMLFNAIEDARIENLLMKDFDGAKDIFDKLYNDFIRDEEFKTKIFKNDLKPKSLFAALGLYLHQELLNLKSKAPIEELVEPASFKKLLKFKKDYDLDRVIDENPVKSQDDAFKLSCLIYELYLKAEKDTSSVNAIEEKKQALDEAKDLSTEMDEILNDLVQQKETFKKELKELESEKSKAQEKIKPELNSLNEEIAETGKQIGDLESFLDEKDNLDSALAQREQILNKKQKKEESLKSLKEKMEQLEKLETLNEKQQKSLASLKEKEKAFQEQNKRYEERLKEKDEEINDAQAAIKKLGLNENQTIESAQSQIEAEQEKMSELFSKKNELLKEIMDFEQKEQDVLESLHQAEEEGRKEVSKALKGLNDIFESAGLPGQVLPSFENTHGWDEADQAQKDFDQDATAESGEVVINGQSLSSSGIRDILHLVDEAKTQVAALDVAKIFQNENKTSLLESFNEQTVKNTLKTEGFSAASSTRKHIPLSQAFDRVKSKTKAPGHEIKALKAKHHKTIESLKNILRLKLSFKKKAKFKSNQDEGSLDTRALWKMALKDDDRLFETVQNKFINHTAVSLALDVSGSMDKDETLQGLRLKELSLMLSEALKSAFVRHEILGYHAPLEEKLFSVQASDVYNRKKHALETIVYKGFSDQDCKGLENIEIQPSDNSDGESLKIAGDRLLKERSKRKILFVLTDGMPYLSGSDVGTLDQHLKDTLKTLRQKGIEVYAFGFNEAPKAFYDNYCQIKDYADVLEFFKNRF